MRTSTHYRRPSRVRGIAAVLIGTAAATPAGAQTFLAEWSKSYGAVRLSCDEIARSDTGSILVGGKFWGTVDLGGGPMTSAGGSDAFVVLLDANGNHLWSRHFGGVSDDLVGGVEFDDAGNVYVTGTFRGPVDFGGGPLPSAGENDIFVLRLDASGVHTWSRRFGAPGQDGAGAIAVDSGGVLVTGTFPGTIDFGGGPLVADGYYDLFLLKLDGNGSHIGSVRYGDADAESGTGIALDGNGNAYVSGQALWEFFDQSGTRALLIKFDSAGSVVWSREDVNFLSAVEVDAFGDVVAAGSWTRVVPGDLSDYYYSQVAVVKYDAGGDLLWSKEYTHESSGRGIDVDTDVAGNVYVVGSMPSADFGGGMLTAKGLDAFLLELDHAGNHVWSQRYGSYSDDAGNAVAVTPGGEVVWAGNYATSIDFGDALYTSAGLFDGFVVAGRPDGYFAMTSIQDVPDDQGRAVTIAFPRASYEFPTSPRPVIQYEVYLRDDPVASASASRLANAPGMISDRTVLDAGWIFVGVVPATGAPSYEAIMPTVADSTIVDGMHASVFFVRAATADPYGYFDAPADSGYSIDNLAPTIPTGLAYVAPWLSWNASPDADFNYFALYGSYRPEFDATVIFIMNTTQSSADLTLAAGYAFYYVRAVDYSGNQSPAAAATGDPDTVPPSPPQNLQYVAGEVRWTAPSEPDVDHYIVYGSMTNVFDDTKQFITDTAQTSVDASGLAFSYYFVIAIDLRGNQSAHATTQDNYPPVAPVIIQFDGATLVWQPCNDAAFDHYGVYGSTSANFGTNSVLLRLTTATSVDLTAYPVYSYYYVTAFDHTGNESGAGATADDVPPVPAANVQYDGQVVSWDASPDPGVDHYSVYGSNQTSFGNSTAIGQTTATSLDVASNVYRYFFVTVSDRSGNESGAIMVVDEIAPSAPTDVHFRGEEIAWSKPPQADVGAYIVYGSEFDVFDQPKTEVVRTTATSAEISGQPYAYYFVTARDLWGNESTGTLAEKPPLPTQLSLNAFPNPFNPETTIRYELPRGGYARIAIYDAKGAQVQLLVNRSHEPGSYDVRWTGTDATGNPVGSGVYFARLDFSGDVKTRKLVLLK